MPHTKEEAAVISAVVNVLAPTFKLTGISKADTRKYVNSVVKTLGEAALKKACRYKESNGKAFEDYCDEVAGEVMKLTTATGRIKVLTVAESTAIYGIPPGFVVTYKNAKAAGLTDKELGTIAADGGRRDTRQEAQVLLRSPGHLATAQ